MLPSSHAIQSCGDCERHTGIRRWCLPNQPIAPGRQLAFQVQEQCGSAASAGLRCRVSLGGARIRATVRQFGCFEVTPAVCTLRVANCTLPGLPVGDFLLEIEGQRLGFLQVRTGGGQPTCELAPDMCIWKLVDGGLICVPTTGYPAG